MRIRRVLHVRSSRGLAGPERHLLELLPRLADQGLAAEVAVLYRRRHGDPERHPLLAELATRAIPAWQVEDCDRVGRAATRALRERLAGTDLLALHGHDPKSDWVISRGGKGQAAGRLATVHLHTCTTLPLRLYRQIDLRLLRRFDGVIAVAAPIAAVLGRSLPVRARLRVRVIANGIDAEAVARRAAGAGSARSELATPGGGPFLLGAGRLTRQKGFDLLIRAVREVAERHPGIAVAIAGEGPERIALERQAARDGAAGRVRFLGERGDLAALLAAADGLVLASRDEGSPYVVLEAMALGVPVVATAVGGVPSMLAEGEGGRLVPAGDAAALAAGIEWLCRHRDEAARCAAVARDLVAGPFSAARMAAATAAFYRDVTGRWG